MNLKRLTVMSFLLVAMMSISVFVIAAPFGASITDNGNETSTADVAQSSAAYAGNLTNLDITGVSVTQTWQGYYGNVTGTIQLADALDNILYNWSLASPEGEVYSSTNGTGIDWTYIQCLNFTANGTWTGDLDNAGATSQGGISISQLETEFGIAAGDVDGINETFSLTGDHENGFGLTHDEFFTNSLQFTAGECPSTHLFDTNDNITDSTFQEVLLYEPSSTSVVYASLLDEEDVAGFNGNLHDFEMLVPENGHGVDVAITNYFFYVELE